MSAVKQFKINMPADVKGWLETQAAKNMRSQGAEIIIAIREKMEQQGKTKKADARA